MRIGIDLLGSDTPSVDLFPAVVKIVEQINKPITLVVFLNEANVHAFTEYLPQSLKNSKQIEILEVQDYITMAEDPLQAIRIKKNSSSVLGIRLLKKGNLDAFVTAGNTGALIACATLYLNKLPGIKRPALLAVMPTVQTPLTVIDVGGNVSGTAIHLLQFAKLGAAYHCCRRNCKKARVGLLNMGVESKKGTGELRLAYQLLQEEAAREPFSQIHFLGNVEARDLFSGHIDVLATDGFTGNVVLKTSEGVSSFVLDSIKDHFSRLADGQLDNLFSLFNYAEYPGAIVCGVENLVIKCHGNASAITFYNAIEAAIDLLEKKLISQMKSCLI